MTFNIMVVILAMIIRRVQEKKQPNGKERSKTIFVNDINFCIKILRNSMKNTTIRTNKWVSRKCQVNIQKSVVILYIFNRQSKNDIKKIILFIISLK